VAQSTQSGLTGNMEPFGAGPAIMEKIMGLVGKSILTPNGSTCVI